MDRYPLDRVPLNQAILHALTGIGIVAAICALALVVVWLLLRYKR
jgi:hypothetical protein